MFSHGIEKKKRKSKAVILVIGAVVALLIVAIGSSRAEGFGAHASTRESGGVSVFEKVAAKKEILRSVTTVKSKVVPGFDFVDYIKSASNRLGKEVDGELTFELSLVKGDEPVQAHNVPVRLTVTNVGKKSVKFSTYGLPLSKMKINGDEQLARPGMMHLTFEGCRTSLCEEQWMGARVLDHPHACTDTSTSTDCVTLQSGESVSGDFDVAKYYPLGRSGTYALQIGGSLHDFLRGYRAKNDEAEASAYFSSNMLTFEYAQSDSAAVKTAMELGLGLVDEAKARSDAESFRAFVSRDTALTTGSHTFPNAIFGLGSTITFDVLTASGGSLTVAVNGLVKLDFQGNSVFAWQDGTDSGQARIEFGAYSSVLAHAHLHNVKLKVMRNGWSLRIDGQCSGGVAGPSTFACPINIPAMEDNNPSTQYGNAIKVRVSGISGGTSASNLAATGGNPTRRRLGTGCGLASVQMDTVGCDTANTVTTTVIKQSVQDAAARLKSVNFHNTGIFGTSTDWTEVDSTFSNMANAFCQTGGTPITKLTFSCEPGCTYYAYVYPSQNNQLTVYLCQAYFSAPATGGADNKYGVMVHELSHFNQIGNTRDNAYGCINAPALPSSLSRDNAENFEYAIEQGCSTSAPEPEISCGQTVTGSIAANGKKFYLVSPGSDPLSSLTFSTCSGTNYDSYLWIYTANQATMLSSNDDSCGYQSAMTFSNINLHSSPMALHNTYKVAVGGYSSSAGSYTLKMGCVEIACGQTIAGSIGPSTKRFYSFNTGTSASITFSTCNAMTNYDSYIYLYSEDGTTVLNSNDDHASCTYSGLHSSLTLSGLSANSYYQIAVGGYSASSGSFGVQMTCA